MTGKALIRELPSAAAISLNVASFLTATTRLVITSRTLVFIATTFCPSGRATSEPIWLPVTTAPALARRWSSVVSPPARHQGPMALRTGPKADTGTGASSRRMGLRTMAPGMVCTLSPKPGPITNGSLMPDRTSRNLESLDDAECLRLISPGGIGRIAYSGQFGLTVLPVNYKLYEGTIVFRTGQDSPLDEDLRTGIAHAEYKVAFEIDDFDTAAREGWSVLIQGAAHHVDSAAERASVLEAGVEPWPDGPRDHFLRISPTRVTGRRIRQADAPEP
jgi:nitroimidazol reductase NimA-like FMN-containing flavoprotein (pyridoxamine 5'-phosphate oxidase superfamily)